MIHCLHGAVGSFRDWDPLRAALPDPVHAHDLWRLFDEATPSLPEAGALIAAQARPGDIILGYSLGGRLALHALLADPAKWRAAIIISAHPGLTSGQAARCRADQKQANHATRDWDSFLAAWNAQGILSGSLHGFHQASKSEQNAVALSFRHWSLGTQRDLTPGFGRLSCPVLWLTGGNDIKFTGLAARSVPLLPRGRHQVLPACGHRLPWERPGPFHDAVENFLAPLRNPDHT